MGWIDEPKVGEWRFDGLQARAWCFYRQRRGWTILMGVLPVSLDLRRPSLVRGTAVVLACFAVAFVLSDFPRNRPTLLLAVPSLLSIAGTLDTIRCMQRRWNFYHAGVVLCIYMDLMAVAMILFMFLYPYMLWVSQTR